MPVRAHGGRSVRSVTGGLTSVEEVRMRMRPWTTLALLLAVFTMHGLQCTSAGEHTGAGPVASHTTTLATGSDSSAAAMIVVSDPGHAMPSGALAADPASAVPGAGHGTAPPSAGHLLTACLAVLAAGLAALLVLLGPRLSGLTPLVSRLLRPRRGRWPTPPRPPDLFSLCVLRT